MKGNSMFGSPRSGANAYAKVGLETGVVAASPHKLVVMLFEGAILACNNAIVHMKAGQFEQKGVAISKAVQIVDEGLRASLDKDKGGEIAVNLDALYGYIVRRLLEANLRNQPEPVQEAVAMLGDLKGAWEAISPSAQAVPAPAAPSRAAAFDSLAPRAASFVIA
jgi:flagellar protein FliS